MVIDVFQKCYLENGTEQISLQKIKQGHFRRKDQIENGIVNIV